MIKTNHNHKLQTNPWHGEKEPHNNNETPESQTKPSNQLSLCLWYFKEAHYNLDNLFIRFGS